MPGADFNKNILDNHWLPFTANRSFKQNPDIITKASGMYVWDNNGNKIIDGTSGLFNCNGGHSRPEIAKAVYEQLQVNSYTTHFQLATPQSFALAQRLAAILPTPINHLFFCSSGSEAIDSALKMVMAYHSATGNANKRIFVSRERAYHGVNIGGLSLSGIKKNREHFYATMPGIVHMRHTWQPEQRFCCHQPQTGAEYADDLLRFCDLYGADNIAAVFVEPIAGSTGVLVPPKGYLERLRQICTDNDILLVFDEVICGFGRLGTAAFASQKFEVTPDIITMAKAITNGAIPMGAVAVKDEIYQSVIDSNPQDGIEFYHGYTSSAHPAACAAAMASLDIYEQEQLFFKAEQTGNYLIDSLWQKFKDHPLVYDLRGLGMLTAIEFKSQNPQDNAYLGAKIQKSLFASGLYLKFTANTAIIAPALIADNSHIDEIMIKLETGLANL